MATVEYAAFLAVTLFLQACSVAADFDIPFLPPFSGNNDPCRESVCGKGKCVVSNRSNFGYECQCDYGWKQARSDDDDIKFLPCVIPNCTLNFNCANAPAPASNNQNKPNFSFLDPCFWTYCGGGTCNKTSVFTHTCDCEEGYFNLFNSTAFPCYKECALGLDCASLGLNMNNSTTSRPGSSSSSADTDNSESHALSLIPRVGFGSLTTMMTTLALVVWK